MKSYNNILVACTMFFACFCYAQTPCSNGFAGIYPCNDYDLMSHIPMSTLSNNAEGSDVWGWTDPSNGKEYAIIATTNSTAFVDVTNPISPIFLGKLPTEEGTNSWRDVKIYLNYAFIVADGNQNRNHGMQVFNLEHLRAGIDPDLTYSADTVYTGVGSCHNIVINESEAVAYLVGCNSENGGPIFIDISTPLNPTNIGSYPNEGYTHDAQVITYNGPDTNADPASISSYVGREILIASNGRGSSDADKMVVLDVTDKSNPIKISEITYSQPGYTHQGWFTDDHRYFILGDETDEQSYGMNTRTLIFDLIDLDNPVLHNTYSGPSVAIDHNGYVKNNTYFMANYRAGMRVLDIPTLLSSNNTQAEIGYFDTYEADDNTAFNGAWSIYPYFSSGNIIISDIEKGLFIVRKSGTLSTNQILIEEGFSISPNPSFNQPTIKAKQNQAINSIEIHNILGQKVFSKSNIKSQEYVLPTSNYAKGVYLVRINSTVTKKLILK